MDVRPLQSEDWHHGRAPSPDPRLVQRGAAAGRPPSARRLVPPSSSSDQAPTSRTFYAALRAQRAGCAGEPGQSVKDLITAHVPGPALVSGDKHNSGPALKMKEAGEGSPFVHQPRLCYRPHQARLSLRGWSQCPFPWRRSLEVAGGLWEHGARLLPARPGASSCESTLGFRILLKDSRRPSP